MLMLVSFLVAQTAVDPLGINNEYSAFRRPESEILRLETARDAEKFFQSLRRGPQLPGVQCATPEAMRARDLLHAEDPSHGVLADIQIQGEVTEYLTPNFKLLYTKDDTVDRPPTADALETIQMPDGSTRTLQANGVYNYVEAAGHYFEFSRAQFQALGFRVPSPRTEVRFLQVDRSYSMPLIGITLSTGASGRYLANLCGHELFHQVQVEYSAGGLGLEFINVENPNGYDTFAMEGTANAGADMVYGTWDFGANTYGNAIDWLLEPDRDLLMSAYDSSIFWKYLIQQHAQTRAELAGIAVGAEVLAEFWRQRGDDGSQDAISSTLQAFDGPSFDELVQRYHVALAVKEYFKIDPTVPSDRRAFDFVGDNKDGWIAVKLTKTFALKNGSGQVEQSEIGHDRGARYFSVVPTKDTQTFVLRLVAGSDDITAQVVQVYDSAGRHVGIDRFASRDGKVEQTITVKNGLKALFVVLTSKDDTQPYQLTVNPVSAQIPDYDLKCASLIHRAPAADQARILLPLAGMLVAGLAISRRRRRD